MAKQFSDTEPSNVTAFPAWGRLTDEQKIIVEHMVKKTMARFPSVHMQQMQQQMQQQLQSEPDPMLVRDKEALRLRDKFSDVLLAGGMAASLMEQEFARETTIQPGQFPGLTR